MKAMFGFKFDFKKPVFLISLVVVIVLIFWLWNSFKPRYSSPEDVVLVKFPPFSQESVAKIPENFPRQFIVGDDNHIPEVISGSTADVSPGQIEMKVAFKVNLPIEEVFRRYKEYAAATSWDITSESDADVSKFLVIRRGARKVSVNITREPDGSLIQVSYVTPKP